MRLMLLAVLYDNANNKTGFRIYDVDSGECKDASMKAVASELAKGTEIQGLEYENNSIVGSNGTLDRYTQVRKDSRGVVNAKNKSCVVCESVNDGEKYRIVNYQGLVNEIDEKSLVAYCNRGNITLANAKVVKRADGNPFISAIRGKFFEKKINVDAEDKKEAAKVEDTKNSVAESTKSAAEERKRYLDRGIIARPLIRQTGTNIGLVTQIDPLSGKTLDDKLTGTLFIVKKLRVFQYYLLSNMNLMYEEGPNAQVPTMAVTLEDFIINTDFAKKITAPEMLFVYLHESMHIAMKHAVRMGDRDPEMWNIACDMYINEMLIREFGLNRDGTPVTLKEDMFDDAASAAGRGYKMAFCKDGCQAPSINLDMDTPESIYEELMQENTKKQGQGQGQQGQGQGQQSQNQQGQGQGQNQQGQGQNQQGQGQGNLKSGDKFGKNSNGTAKKTFRGREIEESAISNDLRKSESEASRDYSTNEQIANSKISSAVTHTELDKGSFGGETGSVVERLVKKAQAPKINWRKVLEQKLNRATQKEFSYSSPDRRFISRGMTMPGPRAMENDQIVGIKFCIDTSGSIGPEDLGYFFNCINQLLDKYKVDGEILYWDTTVNAVTPFKKMKDIKLSAVAGGGGTDANCIFEYYNSCRDYKTGRRKKPYLTVVLTDGYFGTVDKRFKKYDTIWVIINNGNKDFKPPFGVVAPLKILK